MNLLLDTHIFLWYVTGATRLPSIFLPILTDSDNNLFLSLASVWEINIKHAKTPLEFLAKESPSQFIRRERVAHTILSLGNDPFDRLLICQAKVHGMIMVTVDQDILKYDVPFLPQ